MAQRFADVDEEALLADDGRTDGSLENDDILEDDDLDDDLEDDQDLEHKLEDESGGKNGAQENENDTQAEGGSKPQEEQQQPGAKRAKITFGEEPKPNVVSLKSISPITVEARQKRVERFGAVLPDSEAAMKLKRAQRFGVVNENTAKLARIARFGEVKKESLSVTGKARPAAATAPAAAAAKRPATQKPQLKRKGKRFNAFNLSVMETTRQKETLTTELIKEQEERKKQRAVRFQGGGGGEGKTPVTAPASSGNDMKSKRAQRFGLT